MRDVGIQFAIGTWLEKNLIQLGQIISELSFLFIYFFSFLTDVKMLLTNEFSAAPVHIDIITYQFLEALLITYSIRCGFVESTDKLYNP